MNVYKQLNSLILEDKLELTIENLSKLSHKSNYQKTLKVLGGRLEALNTELSNGTISSSEARLERNKIRLDLISLIDNHFLDSISKGSNASKISFLFPPKRLGRIIWITTISIIGILLMAYYFPFQGDLSVSDHEESNLTLSQDTITIQSTPKPDSISKAKPINSLKTNNWQYLLLISLEDVTYGLPEVYVDNVFKTTCKGPYTKVALIHKGRKREIELRYYSGYKFLYILDENQVLPKAGETFPLDQSSMQEQKP